MLNFICGLLPGHAGQHVQPTSFTVVQQGTLATVGHSHAPPLKRGAQPHSRAPGCHLGLQFLGLLHEPINTHSLCASLASKGCQVCMNLQRAACPGGQGPHRNDLCGEARPDKSCCQHRQLLGVADLLCGLGEISNVGDADSPFHRRGPEQAATAVGPCMASREMLQHGTLSIKAAGQRWMPTARSSRGRGLHTAAQEVVAALHL